MADTNRQEVRKMLVEKRDALDLELRNKTKAIISFGTDCEVQRVVGDPVDQAGKNMDDDIDSAITLMKRQMPDKINEAIRRLHEGIYGICSDCGKGISVKRLKALPFAVRCRDCEESKENSEAQTRKRHQPTPSFVISGEEREY
ncbi:MAG: TraR/DksA family transcriptional regulator [bacterium]|nr:TraR/DksA family transcriptional regulator [bacterium]